MKKQKRRSVQVPSDLVARALRKAANRLRLAELLADTRRSNERHTDTTAIREAGVIAPRVRVAGGGSTMDWTPLFGAFEWVLDIAVQLAHDDPEEVATVERVRGFLRMRQLGLPATVRVDDVAFTIGLIISAIDRDPGSLCMLGPWFEPMQFPTVAELWERAVPRHFNTAQRIGSLLRFASA